MSSQTKKVQDILNGVRNRLFEEWAADAIDPDPRSATGLALARKQIATPEEGLHAGTGTTPLTIKSLLDAFAFDRESQGRKLRNVEFHIGFDQNPDSRNNLNLFKFHAREFRNKKMGTLPTPLQCVPLGGGVHMTGLMYRVNAAGKLEILFFNSYQSSNYYAILGKPFIDALATELGFDANDPNQVVTSQTKTDFQPNQGYCGHYLKWGIEQVADRVSNNPNQSLADIAAEVDHLPAPFVASAESKLNREHNEVVKNIALIDKFQAHRAAQVEAETKEKNEAKAKADAGRGAAEKPAHALSPIELQKLIAGASVIKDFEEDAEGRILSLEFFEGTKTNDQLEARLSLAELVHHLGDTSGMQEEEIQNTLHNLMAVDDSLVDDAIDDMESSNTMTAFDQCFTRLEMVSKFAKYGEEAGLNPTKRADTMERLLDIEGSVLQDVLEEFRVKIVKSGQEAEIALKNINALPVARNQEEAKQREERIKNLDKDITVSEGALLGLSSIVGFKKLAAGQFEFVFKPGVSADEIATAYSTFIDLISRKNREIKASNFFVLKPEDLKLVNQTIQTKLKYENTRKYIGGGIIAFDVPKTKRRQTQARQGAPKRDTGKGVPLPIAKPVTRPSKAGPSLRASLGQAQARANALYRKSRFPYIPLSSGATTGEPMTIRSDLEASRLKTPAIPPRQSVEPSKSLNQLEGNSHSKLSTSEMRELLHDSLKTLQAKIRSDDPFYQQFQIKGSAENLEMVLPDPRGRKPAETMTRQFVTDKTTNQSQLKISLDAPPSDKMIKLFIKMNDKFQPFAMKDCGDPESVFRLAQASLQATPPVKIQFGKGDSAALESDPRYEALMKDAKARPKMK